MSTAMVGNLTSEKTMYMWKIPRFQSYAKYKNGQCLFSPIFSTYYNEKNSPNVVTSLQWQLQIYPTGETEADKRYISVFLLNRNKFKVTARYVLTIIDSSSSCDKIPSSEIFEGGQGWGYGQMVERESALSQQSKFLVNGTLKISCTIFETSINPDDQESAKPTYLEAFSHFENLLSTGYLSDVTFVIGDKSVQLHKAILLGSSPIFQSMFIKSEEGIAENNVNQVKISSDVDYDVIMEMFRYIYARKVNNIEKIAGDLFVVADKYSVTGLKELCEKTLCKNLNVDNALQYLELAVEYNAKNLKSKTLEFAAKKLKNIVKSEEFKTLSFECRGELLLHIACNQ